MKILVLAAGYGTRLYPIIVDTPKSLLEIARRPLIDHILDRFPASAGIREIVVITNNKFYEHFCGWARQKQTYPVPIHVINDGTMTPDDRLGSVGDIDFAVKHHPMDDDILIVGGDNLFDFPLGKYIAFAQKNRPQVTIGLYDIASLADAQKFGVVKMHPDGRVALFEEKPTRPQSTLIAMCFYYIPREAVSSIREYLAQSRKADKAGDYIRWLVENKGVYGFQFEGRWFDIGSIEAYEEAQAAFGNK